MTCFFFPVHVFMPLLQVFPHNVMPANAAAWYMAKRKYYLSEPQDQQLLPFLLKKFPDKFRILGKKVGCRIFINLNFGLASLDNL